MIKEYQLVIEFAYNECAERVRRELSNDEKMSYICGERCTHFQNHEGRKGQEEEAFNDRPASEASHQETPQSASRIFYQHLLYTGWYQIR